MARTQPLNNSRVQARRAARRMGKRQYPSIAEYHELTSNTQPAMLTNELSNKKNRSARNK